VSSSFAIGETAGGEGAELLGKRPICCREILGESVVSRVAQHLLRWGVDAITLVHDPAQRVCLAPPLARALDNMAIPNGDCEQAIQQALAMHHANGVALVLVLRLGAYVEFNIGDFLQFHHVRAEASSRAYDAEGPLDIWLVDAGRAPAPDTLFGQRASCPVDGYVNRLRHAQDLRRLVIDSYMGRCALRPGGQEIRPGV
jgi:hypothetical protein